MSAVTAGPGSGGPKLALVIADRLRERIVRGDIVVGDTLPIEAELTVELGVSRFVVREAMRILEVEGFLDIRRGAGGGPRVRHPGIGVAAQMMGAQLQLQGVPVVQVWDVRTDLVLAAIAEVAVAPNASTTTELEVAVAELAAAELDHVEFPARWIDLTEGLVWLAGNAARFVLVRALHDLTERQLRAATAGADAQSAARFRTLIVQSCAKLVAAIGAGDVHAASEEFRSQSAAKAAGMAALFGSTATGLDIFPASTGDEV